MDYVSLPVSIHSSNAPLLLQLLPLLHSSCSCSSYAPAPSVHYTLIYFVAAAAAAAAVSRRRLLSLTSDVPSMLCTALLPCIYLRSVNEVIHFLSVTTAALVV